MQDLAIFSIGQQRSRWLAARMAAVSGNVANADTPGYKARDVVPFEAELRQRSTQLQRTQPLHMAPEAGGGGSEFGLVPRSGVEIKHSGNSVSLEAEMASLGEARSQHAAVTGILGAFHRMLMTSSRG
ncbi:MAG: flagellar basal body protein [Hyphomicrobiaceae bacterium]